MAESPTQTTKTPQVKEKSNFLKSLKWMLGGSLFTLLVAVAFVWLFWPQRQIVFELLTPTPTVPTTTSSATVEEDFLQTRLQWLENLALQNQKLLNDQQLSLLNTERLAKELQRTPYRKQYQQSLVEQARFLIILAGNPASFDQRKQAIRLLQSADKLLAQLALPTLTPVRKAIAGDLLKLSHGNDVDLGNAWLELNALIDLLPDVPLTVKTTVITTQPSETDVSLTSRFWQAINQLIVIRRNQRDLPPLPTPQETTRLQHSLRLTLEQAQMAILTHRSVIFYSNLDSALNYLTLYYPADRHPAAATLKEKLTTLRHTTWQFAAPDITSSLNAVDDLLQQLSDDPELLQDNLANKR